MKDDLLNDVRRLFGNNAFLQSGCINWRWILENNRIPEFFILKYSSYFFCYDIIKYQKITSNIIKEYYKEIDSGNYWKDILQYQRLDDSIIIEYLKDFSKNGNYVSLIFNQRLSIKAITLLSGIIDEKYKLSMYNVLINYQFLDESFIIDNIKFFRISKILLYQRITPSLIFKIENIYPGFIKGFSKDFKSGIYSKTDIGKDWFITFVIPFNISFSKNSDILYKEIPIYDNRYGGSIYKARVWYKDIITLGIYEKVEIIYKYERGVNTYKRG